MATVKLSADYNPENGDVNIDYEADDLTVEKFIRVLALTSADLIKKAATSKEDVHVMGLSALEVFVHELNRCLKTPEQPACGANLRGAYLSGANLRGAYLRGAYLRGADLWDVTGNKKEIFTFQTNKYTVVICQDRIQIGCKNFSQSEWFNFSDDEITKMDIEALDWWCTHKQHVKTWCEMVNSYSK